ncbi:MAG TPA: ABC transporter ATP-binding protein [Levilinea sp.]|nr:ABC transporter ATP-binding protein [Levilinea sp.]
MDDSIFIRTQQLAKSFQMGRQVVRALVNLDLEIPKNSFTVIMGPSGSGKSTLLYLLGGLDRPTSGSISIGETLLDRMDENHLAIYRRKSIGFVFQSFNLVSGMTALANVAFPMRFAGISGRQRTKKAMEALRLVGLANRVYHRPTELSGGQQQRVAIARALVNDPALILADEPTGNLDTSSGFGIMQLLSELHLQGRTVLVVSHDLRMLRFATQVIYLLDGCSVSEAEYNASILLLNPDSAQEQTTS